ncbi:MAG: VCBS repeat-containing protein, partial [Planctomycetota bacterium]
DGTFTPGPVLDPMAPNPDTGFDNSSIREIVAADFNGDGFDDLALRDFTLFLSDLGVRIWLNDGSGSFAESQTFLPGSIGTSLLGAEDIDNDGDTDIVVTVSNPTRVVTLENDGAGAFTLNEQLGAGIEILQGTSRSEVLLEDLNGDGTVDAVIERLDPRGIGVQINDGAGGFGPVAVLDGSDNGRADRVRFIDFDGDGIGDIVATNSLSFSVYAGLGDGTFGFPEGNSLRRRGDDLDFIDADHDGDFDAIGLVDDAGFNLTQFANIDGVLGNAPSEGTELGGTGAFLSFERPLLRDINSDGSLDVVALGGQGATFIPRLYTSLNDGAGGFATDNVQFTQPAPTAFDMADVNGDGHDDIFVVNDFVQGDTFTPGNLSRHAVLLGDGAGGFQVGQSVETGSEYFLEARLADINGDDAPDAILVSAPNFQVDPRISLLINNGQGIFEPVFSDISTISDVLGTIAVDFDSDGDTDIAALRTGDLIMLTNDGAGGFMQQQPQKLPSNSFAAVYFGEDLDGDGDTDIFAWNPFGNASTVIRNLGGGSFVGEQLDPSPTLSPIVADLNGDGLPDLVRRNDTVSTAAPELVYVVLANNGDATFTELDRSYLLAPPFAAGDVNGDGTNDLVGTGATALSLCPADEPPCLADTNGDGELTGADFNAWIVAFFSQLPACDQNSDGLCNPADFNAWFVNFNQGCGTFAGR